MRYWGGSATLLLVLLAACSDGGAPAAPTVRVIEVGAARSASDHYTGSIHARVESNLGFRVAGKIVSRHVNEGDRVRRGQLLMRLDPNDLALSARSARDEQIAAQSFVGVAKAEADRAATDEARMATLVEKKFVSAAAYERAKATHNAATAALAAARARAEAAGSAASQAANQANYSTLAASADGVVTNVFAEPGQVVAAGAPVLRLAGSGAREAMVAIPERDRASAPRAATARVYGDDREYDAVLREVSGAADPVTRTYAARYQIKGGEALPLGATVTLSLTRAGSSIGVPLAALHDSGNGPGVWVVGKDSTVSLRKVVIAGYADDTAAIAAGLKRGEIVVALGAHLLKQGQRVRVEPQAHASSRPNTAR